MIGILISPVVKRSGLSPEMRIVSAGTHKVSEGEAVQIAGADATPRIAADTDVASPGEGS